MIIILWCPGMFDQTYKYKRCCKQCCNYWLIFIFLVKKEESLNSVVFFIFFGTKLNNTLEPNVDLSTIIIVKPHGVGRDYMDDSCARRRYMYGTSDLFALSYKSVKHELTICFSFFGNKIVLILSNFECRWIRLQHEGKVL